MRETLDRVQQALEAKLAYKGVKGSETNYTCPFCEKNGEEHTLHINYSKGDWGYAICHGCHYGARDLRNVLRDVYGYIPKSLVRMLRRPRLVLDLDKLFKNADVSTRVKLPKGFRKLPTRPIDLMSRVMLSYLKSRGFGFEDIDRFNIGYVPDPLEEDDRITGYILFPFYVGGRVVYWQGRRCVGLAQNKSYNPPNTGKKAFLFGYEQAVNQDTVFLAEGPLDAIAWGLGGLALTGKVLQPQQIRALALLNCKRLIVCLDAEEHEQTKSLAVLIQKHVSYKVGYLLLKDKDPADNKDRIRRLAKQHVRWIGKKKLVRMQLKEALKPRKRQERKRRFYGSFASRVEYLLNSKSH